jgi:hypothetical protein
MQSRTSWRVLVGCAAAMLAAGCGPGDHHPMPGTLTVDFEPALAGVADLTISSAMLMVDRIQPIGSVPPMGPPPPTHLTIDALATAPATIAFDHLPQGVYSRLQFSVDTVAVAGTRRTTPFSVHIGMFGGNQIDVRANAGQEIGPGESATLVVDIDVASWFSEAVLDGATVSGGQIVCDGASNPMTTGAISMRVDDSFTLE